MRIQLTLLLFAIPIFLFGQIPTNNLRGYFDFNDCVRLDTNDVIISVSDAAVQGNIIRPTGDLNCEPDCGVEGTSFRTNGIDQQIIFFQGLSNQGVFDRRPFSISFYIKPDFTNSISNLFSKREDCSENKAFSIDYNPTANRIDVLISLSPGVNGNVSARLDDDRCWQHIVFVRDGTLSQLYINGTLRDEANAPENIDLSSSAAMVFSSQICSNRYAGLIDELAFYEGAVPSFEVEDLYFAPDKIINRDTTVFLGDSVNINITNTCADLFQWFPNTGVTDPQDPETTLKPGVPTTYTLEMYGDGCTAIDEIFVNVIDPDTLDCTVIYLPTAFTPNNDGLNDIYRINNPKTFEQLITFEIVDRWGARIFATDDPTQGWDGTFDGQEVNPGVFLYRVRFICDLKEEVQVGSLTLLR